MNELSKLNQLGQSIWYDFIDRSMLKDNGLLVDLIKNDDLRGITTNPAIYNKAILETADYDEDIASFKNADSKDVFYEMAIKDIQKACDYFTNTYQKTAKKDGYVSIEVSPELAFDEKGTVLEAKMLWQKINRPNAMIKVPATDEGISAMYELITEGINVNMTLIFSVKKYEKIIESYKNALLFRVKNHLPIDHIASVASFFVSRIDSAITPLVDENSDLIGQVAIANAVKAYAKYLASLDDSDFQTLFNHGAQKQRLLWASTGTKDARFSDVYYVEKLSVIDTVNTLPPKTYDAFRDHGKAELQLFDIHNANAILSKLENLNINLDEITDALEKNGIEQFKDAFDIMLHNIKQRV